MLSAYLIIAWWESLGQRVLKLSMHLLVFTVIWFIFSMTGRCPWIQLNRPCKASRLVRVKHMLCRSVFVTTMHVKIWVWCCALELMGPTQQGRSYEEENPWRQLYFPRREWHRGVMGWEKEEHKDPSLLLWLLLLLLFFYCCYHCDPLHPAADSKFLLLWLLSPEVTTNCDSSSRESSAPFWPPKHLHSHYMPCPSLCTDIYILKNKMPFKNTLKN